MAIKRKYQYDHDNSLRDVRPWRQRMASSARDPIFAASIFAMMASAIFINPLIANFADVIVFFGFLYFIFLRFLSPLILPFKLPKTAGIIDQHQKKPDGTFGKADGILYLGNDSETDEEIWFTNNDARTHILYLGTTGSGKTEGLKSIACNALCWGSGFIYIDGKADTDLWSTISALARRLGRDDDLLIMNYMTGNVGGRVPSNTLNPFSSGSASYLTNMLVSLMPDAEGDNAMWKERAVALVSGLMPALVWKRDNQNIPLSVGVIRRYLGYMDVIKLARDKSVPDHLKAGVRGYLNELPGYVDSAYDEEGNEKPPSPDAPPFDSSTPRQQHGYLSMQFTRSLQSLGDDYGFIFDTQAADIDMMDVVLQRRILIVLIPALEKSSDETANLGKIIASTLKGMMGATLGSTVEGSSETAIENKPTRSSTPFISIFDEVGYYTAAGMAVMAAQARSLGFSLIFSAQDLPALEKRVKEEARSITANCNIKLFGKLEDPTQTKDFFEKTVGQTMVAEATGYAKNAGGTAYTVGTQAQMQMRAKATYDGLKNFTEGRAVCSFGQNVTEFQVYYASQGFAKAMRVQRFVPVPPPSEDMLDNLREVDAVLRRLRSSKWEPETMGASSPETVADMLALAKGFEIGVKANLSLAQSSAVALAAVADARGAINAQDVYKPEEETAPAAKPADVPVQSPLAAPGKAEDASSSSAPLSWMDVITNAPEKGAASPYPQGAGAPQFNWDDLMKGSDNAPAEPLPILPTGDEGEAAMPVTPLSWSDVIGMTPAAPAAAAPAAEPAQKPVEAVQENPFTGALSWADVIGANTAKDDKTGE